jgi:chromate reductase
MSKSSKEDIHIVVVKGSVRPGNYTSMAVNLVVDEISRRSDATVQVVDPVNMRLPYPGMEDSSGDASKLREAIRKATGVILTTPEYHGGYSSIIKLVIENLGFPSVLSGKPVSLLGVAAGQIGAIKSLESLRGICSHIGAIVLPAPVSVANVRTVFDEEGNCLDKSVEKRIRSAATHLIDYIQQNICPRVALEAMVRSGTV